MPIFPPNILRVIYISEICRENACDSDGVTLIALDSLGNATTARIVAALPIEAKS
jgi:hypothetical protein